MVMNLAKQKMPSGYCPCALLCETFSPVWRQRNVDCARINEG
jgi:hypothetical protein